MAWPHPYPDLQGDERTTLTQFLDHWRGRMVARLEDLSWEEATAAPLPATRVTVAGIVRHLAHAEDRWFHFRLGGNAIPEPWASADTSVEDWSFQLAPEDSISSIVHVYGLACTRSRAVEQSLASLDDQAPVPSFGTAPITLRWALVHLLEETACHGGHVDLLRDALLDRRLR